MDYATLKSLLAALERHGVTYAVFGAVELSLHGLVRFTEDLDIFIAPDASNVERLKSALCSVVDDAEIDQITAADLLGSYPAVQYVAPDGAFRVDILARLGTAFAFADLQIDRVPFDGLTVSVVSVPTLYRMKKDTVRLKDRADAELLKQRFNLAEE